jgi:hypothetical protein
MLVRVCIKLPCVGCQENYRLKKSVIGKVAMAADAIAEASGAG